MVARNMAAASQLCLMGINFFFFLYFLFSFWVRGRGRGGVSPECHVIVRNGFT